MKRLFVTFLVLCVLGIFCADLSAIVKVGELVKEKFETAHPYTGIKGLAIEKEFYWPGAGYIAIHFSRFDLAAGDYVEVSSPDGRYVYTYKGKGKSVRNGKALLSEFWATHIPGDKAIVRLVCRSKRGGWGFAIDHWARGYESTVIDAIMMDSEEPIGTIEAICNIDDKKWAKCYDGTTMYTKSKTVCRLLIDGTSACTGWLVGSQGHVMTNNHCISTQSSADNTDYEFMAEGALCTTNCASWGACPGVVEATSGTMVKTDSTLDYTLILLPTNITATYGYLQLRNTLPTIGERIYIPQHPGAYGKQLAVESDTDGPYAKVYSTDEIPCMGGPGDIGYYADTAGGSSGSPVIAYTDNMVVSLHHCATCPNRGVPIPSIITSLGALLPADAIGGTPATPPAAPSILTATAAACHQVNLTWQDNSDNETQFNIERSTDGTNFSQLTTVGINVTTYSDTSAAENTAYWYRVRAYNSGGYSAYSNVASATTPVCPPAPPAAPSNLVLTGLTGAMNLTWTDNSTNEDGFKIYRGTTSTNLVYVATVGPNVTTYTNSGLARRTRYYFKVCAYNGAGESCSSVVSGKTK